MNQPRRLKRNNETVPCLKPEYSSTFTQRRDSKTPDLCNNTPKNLLRKKKTPFKICVDQKVIPKVEKLKKDKSQKDISKSCFRQPTLCETGQIKIPNLKCQQCENYQKRQKQFLQRLKQYQGHQKQFQGKFESLKQEYEKKLKRYKVKSRIQKDQLKLLKWILSERKEFHQILQKLQKMKEKGVHPLDQNYDKQNSKEQDIPLTDRTLPKSTLKQKIEIQQKTKSQKNQEDQFNTFPCLISQLKLKTEKIQIPTQREVQMFNHINFLQQKVMQLTMRNDFLEKLKMKENPENKPKSFSYESASFIKDLAIPKNEIRHNSSKLDLEQDYKKYYHQYSDEDQNFDRQFYDIHQVQNQLFDSLHKKKYQVESRYISPLKQRSDESNKKQTLNEFYKKQEKNNDVIPQSRSKYYDSIKERSRLLGI